MPTPEAQSRRTRIALAAASVAVFLSLSAAGAAFITRFKVTNEARHNNAVVWHGVICSIEQAVVKSHTITHEKKLSSLRFYDDLLVNYVKTAPCGLVAKLDRR
jgi:hypothetical protein